MNHFKTIIKIISKVLLIALITIIIGTIIGVSLDIIFECVEQMGLNTGEGMRLGNGIDPILGSVLVNIAIVISVFIVYKIFEKEGQFSLGWRSDDFLKKGFVGILWGIILISISFIVVWLLRAIRVVDISLNPAVLKSIFWGIILFLSVAIGEELLSRGYIQGIIKRHYGAKAAVIISSLIFSLLHLSNPNILQNPIPLISIFLAGILFGISREITGDLWIPIGLHFSWNFFQGNIYGFEVSGTGLGPSLIRIERIGHPLITGAKFGLEGSIITMVVLIMAIYFYWWYCKGRNKPNDLELEL